MLLLEKNGSSELCIIRDKKHEKPGMPAVTPLPTWLGGNATCEQDVTGGNGGMRLT